MPDQLITEFSFMKQDGSYGVASFSGNTGDSGLAIAIALAGPLETGTPLLPVPGWYGRSWKWNIGDQNFDVIGGDVPYLSYRGADGNNWNLVVYDNDSTNTVDVITVPSHTGSNIPAQNWSQNHEVHIADPWGDPIVVQFGNYAGPLPNAVPSIYQIVTPFRSHGPASAQSA